MIPRANDGSRKGIYMGLDVVTRCRDITIHRLRCVMQIGI